ncbi:MAG: hypothetical protein RLZZ293_651 [Pseudomonadota bacterium]|jgi:hypothetical protein
MKKLLAVIIASASVTAVAESFQDFNNNLYLQYGYISPDNGSTYTNKGAVSLPNTSDWGVGGTIQTKNNIWFNGDVLAGSATKSVNGTSYSASNYLITTRTGYAFSVFDGGSQGLQVIPYALLGTGNVTVSGTNTNSTQATVFNWGAGAKTEYRLGDALKASLDLATFGSNGGKDLNDNGSTSTDTFMYSVSPEVQYDISKTFLVSVGYTYTNAFNSNGNDLGNNGTSVVSAKVGYLF